MSSKAGSSAPSREKNAQMRSHHASTMFDNWYHNPYHTIPPYQWIRLLVFVSNLHVIGMHLKVLLHIRSHQYRYEQRNKQRHNSSLPGTGMVGCDIDTIVSKWCSCINCSLSITCELQERCTHPTLCMLSFPFWHAMQCSMQCYVIIVNNIGIIAEACERCDDVSAMGSFIAWCICTHVGMFGWCAEKDTDGLLTCSL